MILSPKEIPRGHIFLARFTRVGRIGCGASGSVYTCLDKKDGTTKALKALKNDREGSQLFRNEVKMLHDLKHVEGIPRIYGEFSVDMIHGFVTELFLSDIWELVRESPTHRLNLDSVLTIANHVYSILEDIHRLGFVHRDLKADNVVLKMNHKNEKCPIKIIDLGMSNSCTDDNDARDSSYRLCLYASIDMQSGKTCSKQCDMFMALYMMLFILGEDPFEIFSTATPNPNRVLSKKLEFERRASEMQPHGWIVDILQEIMKNKRNADQHHSKVKWIIRNAKRGFRPNRHVLELKKNGDGKYYL